MASCLPLLIFFFSQTAYCSAAIVLVACGRYPPVHRVRNSCLLHHPSDFSAFLCFSAFPSNADNFLDVLRCVSCALSIFLGISGCKLSKPFSGRPVDVPNRRETQVFRSLSPQVARRHVSVTSAQPGKPLSLQDE